MSGCLKTKEKTREEQDVSSRVFNYLIVVMFYVGGDLLSHTLTSAVPSAQALASGFGMGPGVSLPL